MPQNINAVNLTTSGLVSGNWNSVDLTGLVGGPPSGVMLWFSASSGHSTPSIALRMGGSTDTWQGEYTAATNGSQMMRHVGTGTLNTAAPGFVFQIEPSSTTWVSTNMQVVGLWGPEVTWLPAAVTLTTAISTSSFTQYNIQTALVNAGYTAGGTAIGVVISIAGGLTGVYGGSVGGSPGNLIGNVVGTSTAGEFIVGCGTGSNAGLIELRCPNATGLVPWIVGYFPANCGLVWNPVPKVVTPNSTGTTLLQTEPGGIGYIYQIGTTGGSGVPFVLQSQGVTGWPGALTNAVAMYGQVVTGPNPQVTLSTLTNVNVYEVGYFVAPTIPNPFSQTTFFAQDKIIVS